jgi:hypothetical protein
VIPHIAHTGIPNPGEWMSLVGHFPSLERGGGGGEKAGLATGVWSGAWYTSRKALFCVTRSKITLCGW